MSASWSRYETIVNDQTSTARWGTLSGRQPHIIVEKRLAEGSVIDPSRLSQSVGCQLRLADIVRIMTDGEAAAVTVAVIALVVSVLAAGFTGWEAVNAHLARTRLRLAAWAVSYRAHDGSWLLHNIGGSVASHVKLRITMTLARERQSPEPYRAAVIDEPVNPGGEALVRWQNRMSDPRKLFLPPTDGSSSWHALKNDDDATSARYMIDEQALVTWRDYRGRNRSGFVALR